MKSSASRTSAEDVRRAKEPLLGSLASFLGIGLLIATPMWVLVMGVVHNAVVRDAVAQNLALGGLFDPETGLQLTPQQVYWSMLGNAWLVLASLLLSTLIVGVVMVVLSSSVLVWRLIAVGLKPRQDRLAHQRYSNMVEGPVELTDDAWSKNLPEPDAGAPDPAPTAATYGRVFDAKSGEQGEE